MAQRDPFLEYRERLEALDFRPSRRLGQNFLLDPSLHRVLVDAVDPQPEDLVLEVGPGLGFLTRELATRCRVVAVEVDSRLHSVLARDLPAFPQDAGGVRLIHGDILRGARLEGSVLAAVAEERAARSGRFLLVANLPYNISGPVLAEFAGASNPPDAMAVLVQLELAQRVVATPSTREYGALSAQLQLAYDPTLLRRVGRQVFRPRPNVDSAMLHLRPRTAGPELQPGERGEIGPFLRSLFSARRKKLRNATELAKASVPEVLKSLLEQRPDATSPSDLLSLFRATRMSEGGRD